MSTFYDLFITLVGTPPSTEVSQAQIVAYICASALAMFIIWSLLNLILTLFRWLWGK